MIRHLVLRRGVERGESSRSLCMYVQARQESRPSVNGPSIVSVMTSGHDAGVTRTVAARCR